MRTSYYALSANAGELKFLSELAANSTLGVAQTDFDEAEEWAMGRINQWILQVASESVATVIISEFSNAAAETDIDPVVREMAMLLASARILRAYETRTFINQGPSVGEQMRRRDWEAVLGDAVALGKKIEKVKRTVKADGTIRRWGMPRGKAGPVVSGPMTSGSMFSDTKSYTDPLGQSWTLPHRSPIEDGSP